MHMSKMTYARVEGCFYEAMRTFIEKVTEQKQDITPEEQQQMVEEYQRSQAQKQALMNWSKEKEGNALIDITKTHLNYEVVPHNPCLNPDNAFKKPYRKSKKKKNIDAEKDDTRAVRGQGIAEFHKQVTGHSARLKSKDGKDNQLSKAEGCLITLPRNYIQKDLGITEEEYEAINQYLSNYEDKGSYSNQNATLQSAIEKMKKINKFSGDEMEKIKEFFNAAFYSFLKVTDTRMEDVLYAVAHLDETFPHLHIMVLPGVISKDTGKLTYSIGKFDKVHFPLQEFHDKMIKVIGEDFGIDASGLRNGATKEKKFDTAKSNRQEREQGVIISNMHNAIKGRNKELEDANAKLDEEINTKNKRIKELNDSNQALVETISANNALAEQIKADTELSQKELKDLTDKISKLKGELLSEEEQKQIELKNRSLFKKMKKDETVKVEMTYEQAQGFKSGIFSLEQITQRQQEQEEKEKQLKKKEQEQDEHQKQINDDRVRCNKRLAELQTYERNLNNEKAKLKQEKAAFVQEQKNFMQKVIEKAKEMLNNYISPLLKEFSFMKIIKDWKLTHNNMPLEEALEQERVDRLLRETFVPCTDSNRQTLRDTAIDLIRNNTANHEHDDFDDYLSNL